MKRLFAISLLLVLLLSTAAWSQFVQVSAQITDPTGALFQGCTVSASFIGQSSLPGPYLLAGSVFQGNLAGIRCDSFAKFTMRLADNNVVTPTPSQWEIDFCDQTGKYCGTALITITGGAMDISSQLHAVAPVLPPAGGGGGGIVGITAGIGLVGGGSGPGSVPIAVITCPNTQTLVSTGSAWNCGTNGTVTAVLTGGASGLQGGGSSGSLNISLLTTCSNGQVEQWNGSSWVCATVSGSPAGSTTEVQFRNLGAFGADSTYSFNSGTHTETVQNQLITGFQQFNGPYQMASQIPIPACTVATFTSTFLPGGLVSGYTGLCIQNDGFLAQCHGASGVCKDLAEAGGTGITGSGTATLLPEWTSATVLGNSPFTDTGASGRRFQDDNTYSLEFGFGLFNGASGGGTDNANHATLEAISTQTDCSAQDCYGSLFIFQDQTTTNTTNRMVGVNGKVSSLGSTATAIGTLDGGLFTAQNNINATVSGMNGVEVISGFGGSASTSAVTLQTGGNFLSQTKDHTVTTNAAVYGATLNNTCSGCTTTNDADFYAASPNASLGTVSHHYGMYIADQTIGASNADPWGIFEAGTAKNQFGGAVTLNGGATCVGLCTGFGSSGFVDALGATGADMCAKINNACTAKLPSSGGTIDARGFSGPQACNSDPFAGCNKPLTLMLGAAQIVSSVPWSTPQVAFQMYGSGAASGPANITGTLIQACGPAAPTWVTTNCSVGGVTVPRFPNATNQLTFTIQHGPYAAGTYACLICDGAQSGGSFGVGWQTDSFRHILGPEIKVSLGGNNNAFGIYNMNCQEGCKYTGIAFGDIGSINATVPANAAAVFWDRTEAPTSASGPTHFSAEDLHINTKATVDPVASAPVNGIVIEGASDTVVMTQGSCAVQPTAYVVGVSTGAITSIGVGNDGNGNTAGSGGCNVTPPTCTIYGAPSTYGGALVSGATCTVTVGSRTINGISQTNVVTAVVASGGGNTGYNNGPQADGPHRLLSNTAQGSANPGRMTAGLVIDGVNNPVVVSFHGEQSTDCAIKVGTYSLVRNGVFLGVSGPSTLACGVREGAAADGGQTFNSVASTSGNFNLMQDDKFNVVLGSASLSRGLEFYVPGGLESPGGIGTGLAANTDMGGTLTASGSTVTYAFLGTYASHPVCWASDETTAGGIKVTYTGVASVTFTTPGASDVIDYGCVGRN